MSFPNKDVKAELRPQGALDHRDLNQNLSYFHSDEAIGAGLPLWLPAGAILREELEKLMKELEFLDGYQRVVSPHIAKEDFYIQSGHLPYYEDSMYPAMELENVHYRLRPMCCPHHHKMFSSKLRSYKELPLRLAEYGQVYRYERSGVLSGLMRVRGLCQNDAHLYCRPSQVKAEILKVLRLQEEAYKFLGISEYRLRLSKWDPEDKEKAQKYVPMPEKWEWAEALLQEVLDENGFEYFEALGEAAFYGPKIDVQMKSIQGKEESAASVQLDFVSGERFDLSYINEKGEKEIPLILHRAPLGSHERMVVFLIEKYQGAFPLWLSPLQVQILPIADRHQDFAEEVRALLHKSFVRVAVDDRLESLGRKVAEAKSNKVSHILVIGDQEVESKQVSWQKRGEKGQQKISAESFRDLLRAEIARRS